ncbi:MAG TPA: hypothetical protein V6C65_08955 [Allocoleopsis sp.]
MSDVSIEDRNVVPFDEKWRVLDFFQRPITPPSTGIYEGELRYYAANKEWATIIEGLIDYLATTAAWDDSVTDERHHAIQQILIFEEGIEGVGMSIDYDAIETAVCQAIECGFEKAAARYLSGTVENLAGGDIVLTPGQAPVVVPPGQAPNDPSTDSDEKARSGGAQAVFLGFKQLILDINSYIVQGLSDADIYTRIKSQYKVEPDMAAAIAAYHASFDTPPVGWTTPVITSTLASRIYCKGNSIGTISTYIIQTWDAEVNDLLGIASALPQAQLDAWFNFGKSVPSSDYVAYSCVPVQSETVTLDLSGNGQLKTSAIVQKPNHRLRIRASGQGTDAANPGVVIDLFYRKNADGTIIREDGIGYVSGAGIVQPSNAKLPYQASGNYDYTVDTVTDGVLTFVRDNGTLSATTVGTITIIVDDLGEII